MENTVKARNREDMMSRYDKFKTERERQKQERLKKIEAKRLERCPQLQPRTAQEKSAGTTVRRRSFTIANDTIDKAGLKRPSIGHPPRPSKISRGSENLDPQAKPNKTPTLRTGQSPKVSKRSMLISDMKRKRASPATVKKTQQSMREKLEMWRRQKDLHVTEIPGRTVQENEAEKQKMNRRQTMPAKRFDLGVGQHATLLKRQTLDAASTVNGGRQSRPLLAGSRPSVAGSKPSLAGSRPSVAGSRPSLAGSRLSVAGSRQSLAGSRLSVAGSRTSLAGSRTSPAGSRSSLAGSRKSLAGSKTSLAGSRTSLAGSRTSLAGSKTSLAGSKTSLAGSRTSLAGSRTSLAGSKTSLAGPRASLAGSKPRVVAGRALALAGVAAPKAERPRSDARKTCLAGKASSSVVPTARPPSGAGRLGTAPHAQGRPTGRGNAAADAKGPVGTASRLEGRATAPRAKSKAPTTVPLGPTSGGTAPVRRPSTLTGAGGRRELVSTLKRSSPRKVAVVGPRVGTRPVSRAGQKRPVGAPREGTAQAKVSPRAVSPKFNKVRRGSDLKTPVAVGRRSVRFLTPGSQSTPTPRRTPKSGRRTPVTPCPPRGEGEAQARTPIRVHGTPHPHGGQRTPARTPATTPATTPVGTPTRKPVGTPVGTPARTPARTPVRTPRMQKEKSIRDNLDAWLASRGKTPSRYRHLMCFGEHLAERARPSQRTNGGLNAAQLAKQSHNAGLNQQETLLIEEKQGPADDKSRDLQVLSEKVDDILKECLILVESECPVESVEPWLEEICSSFPAARNKSAFWICRARMVEQSGRDSDVIAVFEDAVRHSAQPPDDMANALKEFVERMNTRAEIRRAAAATPRSQGLLPENVFASSAVKYAFTETTPFFTRLRSSLNDTRPVARAVITPVRRSTRRSLATLPSMLRDHDVIVECLEDISPQSRQQTLYFPNRMLAEEFDEAA